MQTSTRFTYSRELKGRVDPAGWLYTEMVHLFAVTHPSSKHRESNSRSLDCKSNNSTVALPSHLKRFHVIMFKDYLNLNIGLYTKFRFCGRKRGGDSELYKASLVRLTLFLSLCARLDMLCGWQIAYEGQDVGNVLGTFAALTYRAAVYFKVQYVTGFSDTAHGYSYFLTIQPTFFDPRTPSHTSPRTESKLIQVMIPWLTVSHCFIFVITRPS